MVPLVATQFTETGPALSPDGRWLAYSSGESGRGEVYVRPFPDVESGRVQVSTNGGSNPRWANSGTELFFVDADRRLNAAQLRQPLNLESWRGRYSSRLEPTTRDMMSGSLMQETISMTSHLATNGF